MRVYRVCKLLGWIALGVGAPVLAAAVFEAIEDQEPFAPSAFAPETDAHSDHQLLKQDPAEYDWKAAVTAERRRLESERTSIYARENMARELSSSSSQSIASASSDLPSGAKALVGRSAADATPIAAASPWAARDADSTVREVAPDFSELGSVSPPSGVQATVPTPPSVEASIFSTPPPFGSTGGATPLSDTTNALTTPPSGALVAPTPTPLDPLTVVSAPPSIPPMRETAPRPDASDASSLRSPETPAVTPSPPSNAATADSTPRSDEPVASPPLLDAPTIVAALPSDSPTVVSTPHLDSRSISSSPSPDTPSVDSALRSNAATVALKPPAVTSSAVVGISSPNTSHVVSAPPANMATAAASPPVIAARIESERISHAPTISTEIGSLNEDKPTQAVVDRKLDKNVSAATALLPDGMPPRVLIRYDGYSAEARRRAETFAKSLAERGYEVADVRKVASPVRSELRFSYAPDEGVALQIGHLTGVKPVRAPAPTVGLMARPGLIELNVSAR